MAGRTAKQPQQVTYERALGRRLAEIRKAQFPDVGEIESRRQFAEGAGLAEAAYEKMEQRGALSGYAIARICTTYGINPFELLAIPAIGEQVSTSSMRLALINERLSPDGQKELLQHAQRLPSRPIVSARKRKTTAA